MRLNLALHGTLVASATIDAGKCKDEYYLQAIRQKLLLQNRDIIEQIPAKPFFYIEVPASSASLQYRRPDNATMTKGVEKSTCTDCRKDCA